MMNPLARRKLQRLTLRGIDDLIERGVTLPARLTAYRVAHTAERRWPFAEPFYNMNHDERGRFDTGDGGGGSNTDVQDVSNIQTGGDATAKFTETMKNFVANPISPDAIALEALASKEFGGQVRIGDQMYDKQTASHLLDYHDKDGQLSAGFKAQYQYTQQQLSAEFPDGYVTVYRGLHNIGGNSALKVGSDVEIRMDALSSWSFDRSVAARFSKGYGSRVLTLRVPISHIFATHNTNNALNNPEKEYMLLGNKTKFRVKVEAN